MKQPLVSIIIPAYNTELYIEETIRSVLIQSYSNLECIIIDDGSTDNLEYIVKNIQKKDNRLLYKKQENKGVSSARNHGFELSNGEYIAFLDADDLWSTDRIEKMVNVFKTNDTSVGLVHSDMAFINSKSQLTGEVNTGLSGNVLDDLLLWEQCVIPAPSSVLIKRSVIDNIGGFNETLSNSADQEFFFRIANKYTILRLPEPLGFYRKHSSNMSNNAFLIESDQIKTYKIANNQRLFKNKKFRKRCFSNMHLTIAACHWNDSKHYGRSLFYLFLSIIEYPRNLIKIYRKIISILL